MHESTPALSTTASTATWESILGPRPETHRDPDTDILTLNAFKDHPTTPSCKPDYSHPYYTEAQADPAKRNLFQTKAPRQFSQEVWQKVSNLGAPYQLRQDDKAQPGSSRSPPASLKYLARRTVAPFFAAAIADNGLTLTFPPDDDQDLELGLANRNPPKEPPCPYIPLVKALRKTIEDLQSSRNVPRFPWHTSNFHAPPDVEKEFFSPAEVPRACWQQMKDDEYTWCKPEKAPPVGVEGASDGHAKPQAAKPHKVFPWNQARDTELYELEALARDGLRLSNATMVAFAHVLNGALDPTKQMTPQALQHSFFTVNDLVHVQAGQFARLAHRIALQRKLNVVRSLNVQDQQQLMKTKISQDIFGGQWPSLQAKEKEARKAKAEKEAEKEKARKARQSAARNQSFRDQPTETSQRRGSDGPGQQQRRQQPQKQQSAPRKAPKKQDRDHKDRKEGNRRGKKGGGGRRQ